MKTTSKFRQRGSVSPNTTLLRKVLVPRSAMAAPLILAVSPLSWREAMRVGGGWPQIRKTMSDHVGIRGLLQAFSMVYGMESLPELLNPDDFRDMVITENQDRQPLNLYLIGSPKANRWTALLLNRFNELWSPTLEFRPDPRSRNLRNVRVDIHKNGLLYLPNGFLSEDRDKWDCGIVVRGPNPFNEACYFTVLAGRSTLGTEAACLAATTPVVLQQIEGRLKTVWPKFDFNQHSHAFFASVHMRRQGDPPQANLDTLKISEVAMLERRLIPAVPPEAGRAISSSRKYNVFLCYNSKDKKVAKKLAITLKSRGLKVWFDEWCLKPGQRLVKELEQGLQSSETAAVLIGNAGLGQWQQDEWQAFFSLSLTQNVPLIPLLLPKAEPANVPFLLKQIQWVDLRGGLTKDRVDSLVEAINDWTKRNPFHAMPALGKQDE